MTELLGKAVETIRRMPPAEQDTIAQAMLSMAKIGELEDIEPEHLGAVMEGIAQAERGEFATDEEVAAAFRRFERRSCASLGERSAISIKSPTTFVSAIQPPLSGYRPT